ncbi:MAG: hypothetical protein WBD67_12525 [Terracidiphilus sp.]
MRRARTLGLLILLLLTAAAFTFSPASGNGWLGEPDGNVPAAQAAAARPSAAQNHPAKAPTARGSETDPSLAGNKPAIRTQMAELLQLANQLQADVDKTNKDMLSLSVVRKADEIEKLARSMKAEKPVRSSRNQ